MTHAVALAGCLTAAAVASAGDGGWPFRVHPSLPTYEVYLEDALPHEILIGRPVVTYQLKRGLGSGDGMEPRPVRTYDLMQTLEPEGGVDQLLAMAKSAPDRWVTTEDINCDGYQDLLLLAEQSEERGSTRRHVWTYDRQSGRFVYQPTLSAESNLTVDPSTCTLRTFYTDAWQSPVFERKTWRWKRQRPVCTRRERQTWDAVRRCYRYVVQELRGQVWVDATRSCSAVPRP